MTTAIGATEATKTQITKSIATSGGRVERYEGTISAVNTYVGTLVLGISTNDGFPLRSINVVEQGGKAVATMKYQNSGGFEAVGRPGTVIRNSDGAAQSVPIETHPDYNKETSDLNEVPTLDTGSGYAEKPGVQTYMIPSIVYSRTIVDSTFTFSESNLVDKVGTRDSPTGMTSPGIDKWLKTGISVQENDDGATITETWLYAAQGWDTDIYD